MPSPLPAWLRSILLFALLCELVAIGWFSIFGGTMQAGLQQAIGLGSLAVHVLAFALTALTGFLLWSPLHRVGLVLLFCAGLVELAQLFAPERQSSLLDFVAGGIGIAIAALAYRAMGAFVAWRAQRRL